jgi:hypothetical protein
MSYERLFFFFILFLVFTSFAILFRNFEFWFLSDYGYFIDSFIQHILNSYKLHFEPKKSPLTLNELEELLKQHKQKEFYWGLFKTVLSNILLFGTVITLSFICYGYITKFFDNGLSDFQHEMDLKLKQSLIEQTQIQKNFLQEIESTIQTNLDKSISITEQHIIEIKEIQSSVEQVKLNQILTEKTIDTLENQIEIATKISNESGNMLHFLNNYLQKLIDSVLPDTKNPSTSGSNPTANNFILELFKQQSLNNSNQLSPNNPINFGFASKPLEKKQ